MDKDKYSPIKPPVTWFGSKSRLVKQIVKYFPPHQTFVDVFGGSGAILLGKRPCKVDVYNDINKKMFSLFRVLKDKDKTRELKRLLEMTPYSRHEFERCRDGIESVGDEIELARQMIVVQRQSHGGLGKQWSYCVDAPAAGYSASVRKFHAGIERLPEISKRIRKTQIENSSWPEVITRYDRPQTLFFLDPPYVPSTRISGKYEHEMALEEHAALVDVLLSISGHAVLSGYSHAVYLPLETAGWQRVEIDVVAQSSKYRALRTECLWVSPAASEKTVPMTLQEDSQTGLSKRQVAALRTNKQRSETSAAKVLEAISTLTRLGRRVTKVEVSSMTGISREHITRSFAHLF